MDILILPTSLHLCVFCCNDRLNVRWVHHGRDISVTCGLQPYEWNQTQNRLMIAKCHLLIGKPVVDNRKSALRTEHWMATCFSFKTFEMVVRKPWFITGFEQYQYDLQTLFSKTNTKVLRSTLLWIQKSDREWWIGWEYFGLLLWGPGVQKTEWS